MNVVAAAGGGSSFILIITITIIIIHCCSSSSIIIITISNICSSSSSIMTIRSIITITTSIRCRFGATNGRRFPQWSHITARKRRLDTFVASASAAVACRGWVLILI